MSLYLWPPLNVFLWRALLLLATTGFCACSRQPLSLEDVVARNTEATGGRTAIEAVHSIQVDLHIVDPGFAVDGVYRAMRPGKMRIDVASDGKHVFTEAFNGRRAWQWEGRGDSVAATATAAGALQHGVEMPGKILGLHEVQQRGHKLALRGREAVDGVDYYVLRLTFADGYTTSLYVDPRTWLITRRRDVRPLHPDVDPTPATIESRYSDFRRISGVQFSFAGEDVDLATGKVLETTTVKSLQINSAFPETVFDVL